MANLGSTLPLIDFSIYLNHLQSEETSDTSRCQRHRNSNRVSEIACPPWRDKGSEDSKLANLAEIFNYLKFPNLLIF